MRIIRCQIDAFGCLKNRLFDFTEDGLNVFQEDNGFGKTTLTVFIKSMFYGLCGNGRTISGNERKKYKPWNSTAFGGYLIFEQDDNQYRITRKFGSTKASDETFIVDEKTGKKTERFGRQINSDEIGIALFGLDSSSFTKTIFLSQEDIGDSFNPNQINGRLMKLVESGDDLGDYDTAKKGLDEALKQYKPGRGKSRADRIQETISENQLLLLNKEQDKTLLCRKREELRSKIENKKELTNKIEKIKLNQIAAVQAHTKKIEHDTYVEKQESITSKLKQIKDIEGNYGGTIPPLNEIDNISRLATQIKETQISAEEDAAIRKAKETVNEIKAQFIGEVPSIDELDDALQKASTKENIEVKVKECYVEETEEKRAAELSKTFEGEEWNKETFDQLRKLNTERTKLIVQLESEKSNKEVQKADETELFIDGNFPNKEEIENVSKKIDKVQDNINIIANYAQQISESKKIEKNDKTKTITTIILIAVGIILLVTSGVLYFLKFNLNVSVVTAIVGTAFSIIGVVVRTKEEPNSEKELLQNKTNETLISALVKEKEENEKDIKDFLRQYGYADDNYTASIIDLKQRIQDSEKNKVETERQNKKVEQLIKNISANEKQIKRYFEAETLEKNDLSGEISSLEKDYLTYINLKERIYRFNKLKANTEGDYQTCSIAIKQFLSRYKVIDEAKEERDILGEIQKLIQRHDEAKGIIKAWEEENRNKKADNAAAIKMVDAFVSRYLKNADDIQQGLGQLKEDAIKYFGLLEQAKKEIENLETYKESHDGVETFDANEYKDEDIDQLALTQVHLEDLLNGMSDEIFDIQKEINELDLSVQEISSIEDEINDLFEEKKATEEKCKIIELTASILQEAKENLATKYLAPVSAAFNDYCELVLSKEDYVRIDEGLNVTVDEYGAFREQDSLSEGTGDLISVCMRLALADALFEKETMPIILDDPFTNLDDNRLQKMLDMIKKVAEDKQVIYLTCHSSRVPD